MAAWVQQTVPVPYHGKLRCPLIQRYFCVVYYFVGKADLSKGYWIEGNHAFFFEIIKKQF